jgi:hypothetical protein
MNRALFSHRPTPLTPEQRAEARTAVYALAAVFEAMGRRERPIDGIVRRAKGQEKREGGQS